MLNDLDRISELDEEGMIDDLESFPDQCREAYDLGRDFCFAGDLTSRRRVVVAGMGGSAIVGDLLNSLLNCEVLVSRSYRLPPYLTPNDLLVCVSYSGNTEETISSMRDGLHRGLKTICISTGGKMERICRNNGVPLISIPSGMQPRASTGYMLFPLLSIFEKAGFIGNYDFKRTFQLLDKLAAQWGKRVSVEDNEAKKLARDLKGRIPLIYGTVGNTDVVAYRWKTQFNENAKQFAFYNEFPELNHNETVGYETNKKLLPGGYALLLTNGYELSRNKLRIKIMQQIFEEEEVDFRVVEGPGGDKLGSILGHVYLGDFVSVYLAFLNGVDPSPVRLIERFKQKMKENNSA